MFLPELLLGACDEVVAQLDDAESGDVVGGEQIAVQGSIVETDNRMMIIRNRFSMPDLRIKRSIDPILLKLLDTFLLV